MSKKKSCPKTPPETMALPLCGADSHAHVDSSRFDNDREEVLARAKACGVAHIGNIFLSVEKYHARKQYFDAHPEVFFTLGMHPCDGEYCTAEAIAAMREAFAADARLKAVGEIGLDYYWDDCPIDTQKRVFIEQLYMARALEKPVVIHCRDAVRDTVEILEGEKFQNYPLLWHCFGGDSTLASRLIDNGWYISIPGPVTYSANSDLRDAVRGIPLDKLMVETDSPYLAAAQWRGQRNEPAFTVFTAHCVAEVRGLPPAALWEQCGKNTVRFFGL